jgi:hypothetical protein
MAFFINIGHINVSGDRMEERGEHGGRRQRTAYGDMPRHAHAHERA